MRFFHLFLFFCCFTTLSAQSWRPVNGTSNPQNNYTLFTNANIYLGEGNWLTNGKLLIKKNRIVNLGKIIETPANTKIIDLEGKMIYPAFIDLYSQFGIEDFKPKPKKSQFPQLESDKKGPYYWNEAIKPEVKAAALFQYNKKQAERYRKMGFGNVLTHQEDGILRGTAALVSLNDEELNWIVKAQAASIYSFFKGKSRQTYPSSLMGIMALIRQSEYDAEWYAEKADNRKFNQSLEAINQQQHLPKIIAVGSQLSELRADTLGDELGLNFIIKSSGYSYERLEKIKEFNAPLIVPINYPKPYDVADPYEAMQLSLGKMKQWEMADENMALLQKEGVTFCITADGLKKEASFFENIQRSIQKGLTHDAALAALTTIPAKLIKADSVIGSLEKGKYANFIITSDTLFKKGTILYSNWAEGKEYVIHAMDKIDLNGNYSLNIDGKKQFELKVKDDKGKLTAQVAKKGSQDFQKANIRLSGSRVNFNFEIEKVTYLLSGSVSDSQSRIWSGNLLMKGEWRKWAAIRKGRGEGKTADSLKEDSTPTKGKVYYPDMAYGWDSIPKAQAVIFRNATIWTNEKEGVVKNQDLLINNGKILMMGFKLNIKLFYPQLVDDLVEIDATNMHLTSGIIDEHSHIAISRGVNESGQAVTAEVNIGDVVNSNDINIYRQLGGGVSVSQLLHGSANPIGGRSAMIKLRWGKSPEEMKIKGADGFIKFALGENVKQSNWGDYNRLRFPQTRMGTEQVFYDAFTRAKEYKANQKLYAVKSKRQKKESIKPRRNLEMEVLAQILDSTRFITCHSYVQAEINMLIHVADSMGFKVNTFTHVLEGYKIADKIKAHGAAASTFSDWWAYKYEVRDAIPYNGAILHNEGVLTAFNSDDPEMGRRLNQEAAKAVKYGGLSQEEAWKLVTLNPAKMLHLDDRMGSIKAGKDADVVLWSDNPLSIYAKVIQNYIDGIPYYDAKRDRQMQHRNMTERARIIELMIAEKKEGKETQKVEPEKQKLYDCESLEE